MIFSQKEKGEFQIDSANLQINGKNFEIPVFPRHELSRGLPKNFSVEIPGKLLRGSWPVEQLPGIKTLDIKRIISLYSSNDEKEKAMLPVLMQKVAMMGIDHIVVDIQKNIDLLDAAVNNYNGEVFTYVHCQAGANRTGLFCLVANIKEKKIHNQPFVETDLIAALTKMLQSGYDWDKGKYIEHLNEVINLCIQSGLLSANLFR